MLVDRRHPGCGVGLLAATLLLACGNGSSAGGDAGTTCTSGSSQGCACPSGGYGTQACTDGRWTACDCTAPSICPGGLRASGSLHTSLVEVDFSGAPVAVEATYQQDVDAVEAGCVGHTVVRIGGQRGCRLEMDFGPVEGQAGGLRTVRFVADSLCPGFLDAREGAWESLPGYGAWWAGPTTVEPSLAAADAVCLRTARLVFPDRAVTLARAGGDAMQVNMKDLVLSGDLALTGDPGPGFQCAVPACGPSWHDGGGGWCVASGLCAPGYHDGGDGSCQPLGACAPGFHDDGTGLCASAGTCAAGYHDGGDGSCQPLGACAQGFHDDGLGACVSGTVCAPGLLWDGGRSVCIAFALAGSLVRDRDNFFYAALPAGGVLLGGGYSYPSGGLLDEFEVWEPATSTWTLAGRTGHPRSGARAVALADGRVLVAGGWDLSGYQLEAEVYDPASGAFASAGAMTAGRGYFTLTPLANGRALAVGGSESPGTAETWDPATGTWTRVAPPAVARQYHSAALLADGRVMVTGGYSGYEIASAEIYDPAADRWTSAASMTAGRHHHASVRLADGSVLVLGGAANQPAAERYDPVIDRWTSAGPLRGGPFGDSAAVLPSGSVLILESAGRANEIYDPAANSSRPTGALIPNIPWVRALPLADGHVMALGAGSPAQIYIGPQ